MSAMVRHKILLSALAWLAALGTAVSLHAQSPAASPAIHSGDGKSAKAAFPPMPPLVSPVDQFRELLALSPAARVSRLTNRTPEIRQRILAKLQDYDAMPPDDRELRLRSTQLRWHLLSFMEIPAANRPTPLESVPESDRQLVRDHLTAWDRLPKDERTEILKYEKVIENLLAQGFTNAAAATNIIAAVPASANAGGYRNLEAFLKLPADQRQQMYDSFQRFFELSDFEKQKMLGALTSAERQQMEVALRKFAQLPKGRRDACLNSFSKFSSMSETERQEFLKNAERWRELSSAERQAWRELVNRLPKRPPLPPGVAIPPPLPPVPSARRAPLQVSLPATNSTR